MVVDTADMLEIIDVGTKVSYPGGFLELEDPDNGYSLHGDAFATVQYTHRKTEVNNRWVEGTFAVSSVRDNAVEALVVWVNGDTMLQYRQRMITLMAAMDQVSFTVIKTIGNSSEQWDCEVSDYGEESQQEFIHRTLGVLRVQLSRRPSIMLTQVTDATLPTTWWATLIIAEALGELPIGPYADGTPARPLDFAGLTLL